MATEPIPHAADEDVRFEEVSPVEAQRIFDEAAHHYLDISGQEFLRRWEAGEYDNSDHRPDHTRIIAVAMLIPLIRG